MEGLREDNAVMRVLFRAGGFATGGVFGAVLAYLFSRRAIAIRLFVLMLVGAMFAPAVQHGRPSEAQAWWSTAGAATGAIPGAPAHFRLRRF
jgi:hypothetical protein